MFGIIADFIASITAILLPCYLAYKSLRMGDPAQTTPWLIYFIMLSLSLLFESWTVFILGWVPFYSWIRLFFFLYLVLPQTQGAKHLYLTYFEPYIVHHERQIDDFIGSAHQRLEQLGLGYMNILVEWIRERILGQASPQPHAASVGGRAGAGAAAGSRPQYTSYASDLLSRFAMPAARTSAANSAANAGASGSMFNMISGMAGAAMGAGAAGTSREVPASAQAASMPDAFIPSGMSGLSSERDKSAFITTQRDRLSTMLKALDKEQRDLDLAYGQGPASASRRPGSSGAQSGGSGGLKMKSRSELSFDQIDYDDVRSGNTPPSRPGESSGSNSRHTTSGNWVPNALGGWLSGDSPVSSSSDRKDRRRDDRERDRDDRDDRYDGRGGYEDPDMAARGWSTAREITESIMRGGSGGGSGDREQRDYRDLRDARDHREQRDYR